MYETGVRILIAVPLGGEPVVLTTNSQWVAQEVEDISNSAMDLGITDRFEVDHGIWLWEGRLHVDNAAPREFEPETVYTGTLRAVTPQEIEDLLRMKAPGNQILIAEGEE